MLIKNDWSTSISFSEPGTGNSDSISHGSGFHFPERERERESPRNNSTPLAMTSLTASATETKTGQKWIMSSSHRGIPAAEGASESEPHRRTAGSSSSTWWWQLPSATTCPHMPFQHALRTRCHAVPDSKHKNLTSQRTHKHTLRWAGITPVWGRESEELKWATLLNPTTHFSSVVVAQVV